LSDPRHIKTPFYARFFSREHLLCTVAGPGKDVYLTFDDGPVPDITPAILEILAEREVQATFFCVGHNVVRYPELFRQVKEAGHSIGNHTFHHLNGWKTPPAAYVEDVNRCEQHFRTRLFRPPYGKFTPSQYFLLRNKYLFVLWSVLAHDYSRRITPDQCLSIAIRYTHPGSVVVFHDNLKAQENLLYALPRFLDTMLEQGYQFGSLGESLIIR